MRILLLILVLAPLTSFGQFKLKGVVRDSLSGEKMSGVNVEIGKPNNTTTTNADGEFEIDSDSPTALVTVSFIGYRTKVQSVGTADVAVIDFSVDPQLQEDRFIKTSLDIGYFGDKDHAPTGVIVNYALQSIGRTSLDISSNFKYRKGGENSGLEFSVSKSLTGKINYLPDNLHLNYRSINYKEQEFDLKQTRALVSNELGRFFAIDVGASYNDLVQNSEQGVTREQYVGGVLGLTKIFSYSSFLKNWGFHSSITYNSDRIFYEIGTYKGLYIKKFPEIVVMAKYYNYKTFDGFLLSIRLKLFDTRYYCCHSWKVYYDDINALK